MRGDGLPEDVCFDCLYDIRRYSKISYALWNTLGYLIQMDEEKKVCSLNETELIFPKDNVEFLIHTTDDAMPSSKSDRTKGLSEETSNITDDEEFEVHFCWCDQCNKEFISLNDLKVHKEEHRVDSGSNVNIIQKYDEEPSLQLFDYNKNVSENPLSCARCFKPFKNIKRLSNHVKKYDFKCKPKGIVNPSGLLENSGRGVQLSEPIVAKYEVETSNIGPNNEIIDSLVTDRKLEDECVKGDSETDGFRILNGIVSPRRCLDATNVRRAQTVQTGPNLMVEIKSQRGKLLQNSTVERLCTESKILERYNNRFEVDPSIESQPKVPNSVIPKSLTEKGMGHRKQSSVTVGTFICNYCGKVHDDKGVLSAHIRKCHFSYAKQQCPKCFKTLSNEENLGDHVLLHKEGEKFICTVCASGFGSKKALKAHIKESHDARVAFVCSVCNIGFTSRLNLSFHHSSGVCEQKFKCIKCYRCFRSSRTFRVHTQMCLFESLSFECGVCGKLLLSKLGLSRHSQMHLGIKEYQCGICLKHFMYSNQYTSHLNAVHLNRRPHECGVCAKSFSFKSDLRLHLAVHSDERPFPCSQCSKSFKIKLQLQRHSQRMHKS